MSVRCHGFFIYFYRYRFFLIAPISISNFVCIEKIACNNRKIIQINFTCNVTRRCIQREMTQIIIGYKLRSIWWELKKKIHLMRLKFQLYLASFARHFSKYNKKIFLKWKHPAQAIYIISIKISRQKNIDCALQRGIY